MDFLPGSLLFLLLLGICLIFIQSRRIANLKSGLAEIQTKFGDSEARFAQLSERCETLSAECRTLRNDPPMPSGMRLADFLYRLGSRLGEQVEGFEHARITSAAPLVKIAEMASTSRVVTRKPKLQRLQANLETANAELARLTDHHVGVLTSMVAVIDSLRGTDIEDGAGGKACDEIERCVVAIALEEDEEAYHGGILHEPTKDFQLNLALKDRGRERARAEREGQRQAADMAFSRYKLPPLTSMDKFRALRSFGRRDGFG